MTYFALIFSLIIRFVLFSDKYLTPVFSRRSKKKILSCPHIRTNGWRMRYSNTRIVIASNSGGCHPALDIVTVAAIILSIPKSNGTTIIHARMRMPLIPPPYFFLFVMFEVYALFGKSFKSKIRPTREAERGVT